MKKYFINLYQRLVPRYFTKYLYSHYEPCFFHYSDLNKQELAHKSYQLRHKVYSEEFGFEPSKANHEEKDIFDHNSLGCVILNKFNQEPVGGIRLVLPQIKDGITTLPCLEELKKHHYELPEMDLNHCAEISRLAILKSFRHQHTTLLNSSKLRANYLLLSLYCASVAMAHHKDITHLFFITEKKLIAHLRKIGLRVEYINKDPVENKGLLYAVKFPVQDVIELLKKEELFIQIGKCMIESFIEKMNEKEEVDELLPQGLKIL